MATGSDSQDLDEQNRDFAELSDAEQSQRTSRVKRRTEKGEFYDLSRLKTAQTSSLNAVSRKRTEMSQLMSNDGNLHLVKSALDSINDLFTRYRQSYHDYYEKLTLETDRDQVMDRYEQRERSFMEFRNEVKAWIALIENQLAEQLDASASEIGETKTQRKDSKSSKDSRRSISEASSLSSAQIKEKAKIAELMAEKSMLSRKRAIKAAEEELSLDIEIAKARAREKVFEEINERTSQSDHEELERNITPSENRRKPHEMRRQTPSEPHPRPRGTISASRVCLPSPVLSISSISDSNPSIVGASTGHRSTILPDRKDPARASEPFFPRSTQNPTTRRSLDPTAPEFNSKSNAFPRSSFVHPSTKAGARMSHNEHQERTNPTIEQPSGNSWQDLISIQQRHNEHIIETNRRLAVAMTLPQPEVPKFTGDPIDYQPFIMAFKSRIESKTNLADCLYYLDQYLNGEPKELISGCLYAEPIEGYFEAKGLLDKEYGDPYKISTSYVNKVLGWPTLKYDDAAGLKRFSFFLKKCNNAMKSLSYMMALDHPSNMQIVVRKLPFTLQNRWRDRVVDMRRTRQKVATFEDLVKFVDSCAEAANDPIYSKAALGARQSDTREEKKRQDGYKRSSFSTNVKGVGPVTDVDGAGSTGIVRSCSFCNQQHDLEDCTVFLKKSINEKKSFLKDTKLCFGCYGNDHLVKGCTNRKKCKTCGKRHPTALHIPGFKLPSKPTDDDKGPTTPAHIGTKVNNGSTGVQGDEPTIFHAIIPVRVRHKRSNKVIDTYAFYDNGSDGCFLTETLKDQLELSGIETTLRLGTMHGQSYVPSTVITDLIVTDLHEQNPIEIPKLYTREFIPVDHKQIPTPEVLANWKHLTEVSEEVATYKPELEIGLLIGSNCPKALEPQRIVPSEGKGPFAIRLHHGWTINGPIRVSNQNALGTTTVNRITIREVERVKEILTPHSLLKTLEMDFNDHATSSGSLGKAYSQEDKLFLERAERDVRLVDGHYELPLPFRQEKNSLPNNRQQAIQRANWQKKKMQQDEQYHRDYVKFVENLIAKGYAEQIPEEESPPKPGKLWYLPHHGLYHAKKRDKIRVVFDCSARYRETSLNDHLLQGPDLTNTLLGVLTRFRHQVFAFMADIESMFYQVKVPVYQRDFLRFLWWPNGDLSQPMKEYRMTVHIFGAVSSPSCSNFALRRTGKDNEDEFGPAVVQTIQRDFYVDDCLKSVDDQTSACDLIVKLRQACSKGGFNLTKFTSNSRDVLASIPEEDRSKEVKSLDLNHDILPIQRALGVQWCVESDKFKFRITLNTKPLTRRGILSVMSSVYDPFGFIASFVLPAKKILQDLCREGNLDWDDEIPDKYQIKWAKWIKELPEIEKLFVDRCLKPSYFGQLVSRQMHIFSDASSTGYGAVAYLRLKDENGNVHCSFLLGKSRLAPVKVITIPRLELVAATLSARMGDMLLKELDIKPDLVKYHTDSTTVLRYISSDQRRFHVFVANRVQTIRELCDPDQWRYVTTKDNPADEASRGIDVDTLLNQSRWLNGPKFLWDGEENWPEQPFVLNPVSGTDPEVRKCVTTSAVSTDNTMSTINKFLEFHSDWNRLKKGVAILLRLRAMLLKWSQKRKELSDQTKFKNHLPEFQQPITVQELEEAELAIIRCVQVQEFNREICALKAIEKSEVQNSERQRERRKKAEIKRTSSIYRVNPFLHRGVLRVGGRLRRAEFTEQVKHPYILPRKNHVTTLLIRHVHQMLGHAGRGHVLATLREKYWIVCANAAVRHELYRCVTCRRIRSPPNVQKMADLPEERLSIAPPFTYVGIDYFGPFFIKEGRKKLKRYGALFTCMASRAIHIEVASSLDTNSFIQALRRFIARRGPVRQIRSDNGTNFVGAHKELRNALKEMNNDLVQEKLSRIGIDWIFNPPSSSHMGGVWERQIRTIRKVLAGILREHGERLDDESFRTILCEIEAIVNSRPITFVSTDPDDLQPLSPNNLLTMKTSIILPPPGNFQREDIYMRRRWRRVQYLANLFWSRWKREYLVTLQNRQKWTKPKRNVAIGDIVLIKEENQPRGLWSMGRIIATEPDKEGLVRSASVKTSTTELRRPVHKLVVLLKIEEQELNG